MSGEIPDTLTDDEQIDYVAGMASGCSDFGGGRDELHAEIVALIGRLRAEAWQRGLNDLAVAALPDAEPPRNPYL